jgi:hypothetical protein
MTELNSEDRAAMRAFLQRSDVRLSTIHRTATSLLSGAGVLVLLPALGRDAIVNVLQQLVSADGTQLHWFLASAVVATLCLSLVVVWLLFVEITRFFFHSNHLVSERGTTFTPRFTLTSLKLPTDDLSVSAQQELSSRRADERNIDLLVPGNENSRRAIDKQLSAYEGLAPLAGGNSDRSRAEALLVLAGARDRTLADEVAKVEYGMARHVLRVQVIVLRYIKALMVVLLTTVIMFSLAAVTTNASITEINTQRLMTALLLVWAPAVLFVTSAPISWLGSLLKNGGAEETGIRFDRELTKLEKISSYFSVAVFVVAFGCGVTLLDDNSGLFAFVSFLSVGVASLIFEMVFVFRARN